MGPESDDRRTSPDVRPGGRRLLTLEQVAQYLQVDVRIVRKLIAIQDAEEVSARVESRRAGVVGLRAVRVSPRHHRIAERDLGAFLNRPRRQ